MNSSMQLCGLDDVPSRDDSSPNAEPDAAHLTSHADDQSPESAVTGGVSPEATSSEAISGKAISGKVEPAEVSGDGTEVERLRAEIARLRDQNDQLEAARQELLEQNRQLRQEATVVRLYKDLARTREQKKGHGNEALPTAAETLYRTLPRTLKVREFFQYADDQGLDTQATRECFVYFLKENMLDQSGAQLEKTGRILRSVTKSEDQVDDRPCTPSYGA